MLIVLIVLLICAVCLGFLSDSKNWDGVLRFACLVILFLGFVCFGDIIIVTSYFIDGCTAKDKIEMYQEENEKIEKDINELVVKYMQHEKETYKDFKTTSPTTLISLYPDLKSNKLVNKQIDIYVENNKKAKKLKEKQIDMKIAKWLLYFGK